jgi:hypothetical protein
MSTLRCDPADGIPACFETHGSMSGNVLIPDTGSLMSVLRRPGGISGGPVPDPIPNSAVKLPCADGTKSWRLGRVGRCQVC